MLFVPSDSYTLISFIVLIVITIFLSLKSIFKIYKSKLWIVLFGLIVLILSLGAIFGITSDNIIPLAPLFLIINIFFAVTLTFSKFGKNITLTVSYTALLGLQSFRFPLELILHQWTQTGVIPQTMTWTGQNIDIVAGIICLIFIPFYKKHLGFVWTAQIIGFSLLLNVIRVAVMSSPFPFSWPLDKPLQLIFHFPYVLIVPCFVTVALSCHLLVFRKLLSK
jgi:hypothetical protein